MRVVREDRPVGAGIRVRRASEDDGPAIAAVSRRVPVARPDGFRWIDHGADWWRAVVRGAGRSVFVAERDGDAVGVHTVTVHPARFDDRRIRLALLGPNRIDPTAQGTGAFRALQRAVADVVATESAEPYALVPVDEPPPRLPRALRRWPVRLRRLVIDCRAVADPSAYARRADPGAAGPLLAESRAGAVIAPTDDPFDAAVRLAATDRVLTNGDAVLAVAPFIVEVREEPGASRRLATATEMAARSEAAAESLVRAWCHRLLDDGVDDLVVWSCAGDVADRAIGPLAAGAESYALDLGLTPPPDAATRGVRVDASLL